MEKDQKQLMFAISNSLSKPEAVSFARTLDPADKYFLLKVSENKKARHLAKRERFIVIRDLHEKESVPNGNAVFTQKGGLIPIEN
jgi:hypothetical protein